MLSFKVFIFLVNVHVLVHIYTNNVISISLRTTAKNQNSHYEGFLEEQNSYQQLATLTKKDKHQTIRINASDILILIIGILIKNDMMIWSGRRTDHFL